MLGKNLPLPGPGTLDFERWVDWGALEVTGLAAGSVPPTATVALDEGSETAPALGPAEGEGATGQAILATLLDGCAAGAVTGVRER